MVRKGFCQPEGVFEKTPVGEVAVLAAGQLCGHADESVCVG